MKPATEKLWREQNKHEGDRWRLFQAVGECVDADTVFYPGAFVDISPSFVFPDVTYLDMDKRTPRFFTDVNGILDIIAEHAGAPDTPEFRFIHSDYSEALALPDESFDLLISLYAGFVSEHCTRYLKKGGTLLVNPSHGDAAMASIDARYALLGVILARAGGYIVRKTGLDKYLVPKKAIEITPEFLHKHGRGIGYTRSAFAYLFKRIQ
jgi:hypothetical protein